MIFTISSLAVPLALEEVFGLIAQRSLLRLRTDGVHRTWATDLSWSGTNCHFGDGPCECGPTPKTVTTWAQRL